MLYSHVPAGLVLPQRPIDPRQHGGNAGDPSPVNFTSPLGWILLCVTLWGGEQRLGRTTRDPELRPVAGAARARAPDVARSCGQGAGRA